jgi:hypothetical protein
VSLKRQKNHPPLMKRRSQAKKRGQARLPNLEILLMNAAALLESRSIRHSQSTMKARGQKGGLVLALFGTSGLCFFRAALIRVHPRQNQIIAFI